MPTTRRTGRLATIVGVALAVAACGGGDDAADAPTSVAVASTGPSTTLAATTTTTTTVPSTSPSTTAPPTTTAVDPRDRRPYEIETLTATFVDPSRVTAPIAGDPIPSRTLPTTLRFPVTDEPAPLIVFSHGFGASPAKFERLLDAWATAGYASAAISFPLTSDAIEPAERSVGDVVNQPADLAFVVDQLLTGEYAPRIDPTRLAAAGLSLGGLTTYLAAIDDATRDPRFVAAVVMAAVPPSESFVPAPIPVLVMHGEFDPVVPAATASATFARLSPPAYSVTMLGGFHAEPFEDEEENTVFPDRERFHPVVDATTTAFWDTYLLADPDAQPAIVAAADRPSVSVIVGNP